MRSSFCTRLSPRSPLGLLSSGASASMTRARQCATEKLFLGWDDVQSVPFGRATKVNLGPADVDDKHAPQAIAVSLPDKTVVTDYNKPASGRSEWWSGRGDGLSNTLTRDVDLTSATSGSVSASIRSEMASWAQFQWSASGWRPKQ